MASAAEFRLAADNSFEVTDAVRAAFQEWGFVLVRGLLTPAEVDALRTTLEADQGVRANTYGRDDGMGRRTKVSLWNQPGDDLMGTIARSEKAAGTFERLLGGEVYHYHSKLIQKDAFEGGAHLWHQDYGYWYHNGCLWPNMGTLFIPVDRATKENGCLRIIPKSHRLGRIEHTRVGDQVSADIARVEHILAALGAEVAMEMEAGDGLFFHCNVLHTSAQNHSPARRWAFLVAYNRADNDPVIPHHHPGYFPLRQVPNSEILRRAEATSADDAARRDFFKGVEQDVSLAGVMQRPV